MTDDIYRAREELVAAVLSMTAHHIYSEAQPTPGAHDGDQADLDREIFEAAVDNYYHLLHPDEQGKRVGDVHNHFHDGTGERILDPNVEEIVAQAEEIFHRAAGAIAQAGAMTATFFEGVARAFGDSDTEVRRGDS